MNQEAKEVLEGILTKDLHELTSNDIAFLKARWDYLNADQKEKYKSVLVKEIKLEADQELDKLNKSELIAMAKKSNVDFNVSKKELIHNILEAQEK